MNLHAWSHQTSSLHTLIHSHTHENCKTDLTSFTVHIYLSSLSLKAKHLITLSLSLLSESLLSLSPTHFSLFCHSLKKGPNFKWALSCVCFFVWFIYKNQSLDFQFLGSGFYYFFHYLSKVRSFLEDSLSISSFLKWVLLNLPLPH